MKARQRRIQDAATRREKESGLRRRSPRALWESALGQLEVQVSSPNFDTWLRHTVGLRLEGNFFIIGVHSDFAVEWMDSRMGPLVKRTVSQLLGTPVSIAFEVYQADPPLGLPQHRPSTEAVLQAVCWHFDLTRDQLSGPSRARDITYARHIAMYLLREHAQSRLGEIGGVLGGRSHSTVRGGYRRIRQEMTAIPQTRAHIEQLESALRKTYGIWQEPRIRAMLEQPLASTVSLTREEAIAIVEAGIGGRPDLPPGTKYVSQIREAWRGLTGRGTGSL